MTLCAFVCLCTRDCHLCTIALCVSVYSSLCASIHLCMCMAFYRHPLRASLPHTLIKKSSKAGPSSLSVECIRLVGSEAAAILNSRGKKNIGAVKV